MMAQTPNSPSLNLRARFHRWMASRISAKPQVTLNRKIIYILPTKNGLLFIFAASLVFIAAINYAVSLAFGLAFLMVSLFIVAILHSFDNLNHLELASLPSLAVFSGEKACFKVELKRKKGRSHQALELSYGDGHRTFVDLLNCDTAVAEVFTQANKRGNYKAPLLRITTYFPLGLCRAWSLVDLAQHCIVYPKPLSVSMNDLHGAALNEEESRFVVAGSEDYYGLREYVPGDSLKQVAWKNVARGQGLQLKQFVDYVDSKTWLSWTMFEGLGVEERLSRLCFCALKLDRAGTAYGLRVPGFELAPNSGSEHRTKILTALALFDGSS
ncbi:MAG: DUF58 domain-containing protein [Pseudohongiellaceae bacterium]